MRIQLLKMLRDKGFTECLSCGKSIMPRTMKDTCSECKHNE